MALDGITIACLAKELRECRRKDVPNQSPLVDVSTRLCYT